MKNRTLIGLALSLAALTTSLPAQEPGSQLRVWLLTTGPGDAVWERFGHNAIRVLDTETGRDAAYNWGEFDFDQVAVPAATTLDVVARAAESAETEIVRLNPEYVRGMTPPGRRVLV